MEGFDFDYNVTENIGATAEAMNDMLAGSDERVNEAKIYDMQTKTKLAIEKQEAEIAEMKRRTDLEELRVKKELEMKEKFEKVRADIEARKLKAEILSDIAKLGVGIAGVVLDVKLTKMILAFNIEQGGVNFKDALKRVGDLTRRLRR